MGKLTKEEMLNIVKDNISKLENKDFNVYFYVLDTKGNPTSSLEYIYQTALTLSKMGYKVTMLHQETDFVGVRSWMGDEYADLPHKNIDKDNVSSNPCDFFFIPEIFANVMIGTKGMSCKRVVLVQNYSHVTEFLPVSLKMEDVGINEAIATTDLNARKIKEYFPNLRVHVVSPAVDETLFNTPKEPRKMLVNFVVKEQSDINQILKPFYWKNDVYKWVSTRDLRGLSREDYATALKEGAITIWADDKTNFGESLLEALKCGGIVLAKVPEKPADWMLTENGLDESINWFYDIDEVPEMLSALVRVWTHDEVPDAVYDDIKKFSDIYTIESQTKEIKDVYVEKIFKKRLEDFKEALVDVENNVLTVK